MMGILLLIMLTRKRKKRMKTTKVVQTKKVVPISHDFDLRNRKIAPPSRTRCMCMFMAQN